MNSNDLYNLRLLYIEDDSDTLEPMTRFLQRRFSKVITAENGEDALRKFNQYNPDIILTDLMIPEISGIELIRKIRERGFRNPIIITSALQDVSSIIETVDIGISKYIIKPIDMAELEDSLNRYAELILRNNNKLFNMNVSERKSIEKNIKHILNSIIKKHSGKGPKDIKVFIGSDRIEISCINVLTPFEITLLDSLKNSQLVRQNRLMFYQILKDKIEKSISTELNMNVIIKEVVSKPVEDMDIILIVDA